MRRFVDELLQIAGFLLQGDRGVPPPKPLLPPLNLKERRKNNINDSIMFKNNGLLSFAPPKKKKNFTAESQIG